MAATPRADRRIGADDVVAGAGAGFVATAVMSALMLVAHKLGWEGEQPPERIVEAALDSAGVARSERTENVAAALSHLAFGAALGVGYRVLRRLARTPGPPVAHGVGWGLAVWSVSYQGWIPRAGILPPPRHDRPGRQATMMAAHVAYGGVLGALAEPRDRT
jgi:hypothetical protein